MTKNNLYINLPIQEVLVISKWPSAEKQVPSFICQSDFTSLRPNGFKKQKKPQKQKPNKSKVTTVPTDTSVQLKLSLQNLKVVCVNRHTLLLAIISQSRVHSSSSVHIPKISF